MKKLTEENSVVFDSEGATEVRVHRSKLCYQVTDLGHSPHVVGHYGNGNPYYAGFPEIVTEYKGELLHGVILKADLRSFDITVKGYPKDAVAHDQSPIFSLLIGLRYLNKERTDLSDYAKDRAIRCLHAIYDRYHHPVTGEFLDIADELEQKIWELKAQCLSDARWQVFPEDQALEKQLADRKSELKSAFKAGSLNQSEYQKALNQLRNQKSDLDARRYQLENELIAHLKTECANDIAEKYDVPLEDCWMLLGQAPIRRHI